MPRTPNLASGSTQSQALREGTVLLGCPLVHRVTQGTVHTLWVGLGPDTMVMQLVVCWSRNKRMTTGILLLFTPGSCKATELA